MKIEKIILLSALLAFVACSKEENGDILPVVYAERTVIVYMAADNDLSADALNDIEEMKEGFRDNGIHLIVFVDLARKAPYILEITPDSGKMIRTYPEINSADAVQMREVLDDITSLYPAHSYGLVLWSHGTSWLPSGLSLKSFGRDHGSEMNISDLATSLPVYFDFILFDACLMGAVEVAYELKDKTDYIIASSAEIIYIGFPYDQIVPELISHNLDLKQVAQTYFNFYDNQSGAYRSATVSLINTSGLEALAAETKKLLTGNKIDFLSFDRTSVQRLDAYDEQYHFDMLDFFNKVLPDADKSDFEKQLNKCVLYKANTPQFIEMYDIDTYCGLSCYIPNYDRPDLNKYYLNLEWYIDSGMNILLD